MALTSRFKSSTAAIALNATGAWTNGIPNSVTDRAVWDTNVGALTSTALGGNLIWGQLQVTGTATTTFTISFTSGATLTLTPTDTEAAGVSIDMSSATRSFTIDNLVNLGGSSHTWKLGNGKQLTLSRAISGSAITSLTIQGYGQYLSGATNSFGSSSGCVVTLKDGVGILSSRATHLGAATNSVVIEAGATLDCATSNTGQTIYSVSGKGTWDTYPSHPIRRSVALYWDNGFAPSGTITITGTDVSIAGTGSSTTTAKLTGTITGVLELVCGVGAGAANYSNTNNDYRALGGVLISSRSPTSSATGVGGHSLQATDALAGPNESACFGHVDNAITVASTGKLVTTVAAGATRNVNRNITFNGRPTLDTTIDSISNSVNSNGTLAFNGELTFTGGFINCSSGTGRGAISFRNKISGDSTLISQGYSVVEFDSATAGAFSAWTGALRVVQGGWVRYTSGYNTLTGPLFLGYITVSEDATVINNGNLGKLFHSSITITAGANAYFQGNPLELDMPVSTASQSTIYVQTDLTISGNITHTSGNFRLYGTANKTLTLSGTNSNLNISTNTLNDRIRLNSNGSCGGVGNVFTQNTALFMDNTSGNPVDLTATGNYAWNDYSLTWGGSYDLTHPRNVTMSSGTSVRTVYFTANKSATLKFSGATFFSGSTYPLSVGGGVASKSRLWVTGANASTASTSCSVTSGYFKIGNSNGLGAVGITNTWAVSSGGAIELDNGITTPTNKGVSLTGTGPDTGDGAGALRSTSGTNVFNGSIAVPSVIGARIQVNDGELTLSTSTPTLNPANANTPVELTARGANAVLKPQRTLGANAVVTINNGGVGTVELSNNANAQASTTCEGGTTKVTGATATGGSTKPVIVKPSSTLQISIPTTKKATLGNLTFGTNGSLGTATFKISNV